MAKRINIIPDEMRVIHERFNYIPAVRVGDVVHIAGQVGRDANLNVVEGKEAQFAQAFENLGIVLRAAGCGFEDVVDMITYHTDMRDLQLFMKVKDRYMTEDFPAWTGIGTTALAMPGLEVEIKATAIVPD
jgi:enamine deaminase RidA (YjgF/YER057c/UK114 family)